MANKPLIRKKKSGAPGRIRTHDPLVRRGSRKSLIHNGVLSFVPTPPAPYSTVMFTPVPQKSRRVLRVPPSSFEPSAKYKVHALLIR